jgi:hypothetical protein
VILLVKYRHHIIDTTLPGGPYGQTALADINNDGKPEFITGHQYGNIYYYVYETPEKWHRYLLGKDSPSDVGAAVADVDGDGWLDFVTGGACYRNSRKDGVLFERIVFDPELNSVHDVIAADIDGDGKCEIITMSDKNDLRWYKIPDDPYKPWPYTRIGDPVHSGATLGDINGDGSLDVVRTNAWFENVKGDGTVWREHPLPFPPQTKEFLTRPFMVNATHSAVCDMDKDGHNDIVMVENEMRGGKLFWLENINGDGSEWVRHDIALPEKPIRGAYHSLWVGDIDLDGDLDIMSCEMEDIRGDESPKYFVWENVDGKGFAWQEHVILDVNLGGHAAMVGDVTGNGFPDIISKPWMPYKENAVGGKTFVVFLENTGEKL